MKFEELPGIPGTWLEFLQTKLKAYAFPATIPGLVSHAATLRGRTAGRELMRFLADGESKASQISGNIVRLSRPDAVVVAARIYSCFLGGPIGQILKCLTSIKLCEQLRAHSINAVPISWIDPEVPAGIPRYSVTVVNESELLSPEIAPGEIVADSILELLSNLEAFGRGAFDVEALHVIKQAFAPGQSMSSATASLFKALLHHWGMIVLDPAAFHSTAEQGMQVVAENLPVLASVVDPFEVSAAVEDADRLGDSTPRVAWPQVSATIGDVKSRRTLERYQLELRHLYEGEATVLGRIKKTLPSTGLERLTALKSEVEAQIGELRRHAPNDGAFPKLAATMQEKVVFQLNKLRDQLTAALTTKEQVATRRIHSACTLLAPGGRIQEREIGSIQIPLRYSISGLSTLYEQMELMTFEHQLIWME
jgi:uncharacterized protein YllA (UPF0747 family)